LLPITIRSWRKSDMDDKPKFIAKSIKVESKALAVSKDAPSGSLSVPDVPDIPTFDLDQLNLIELSRQLKDNLDQPEPFFMFTSRRRNEKLRLGKERLEIILETIERVRSVNQSLANARAEILLSKAITESLINNYFNEAILTAELRKAEHNNSVSKHYDEMRARDIQLEAGNLANLKSKAEINLLEAHTKEAHAKADLVKYVVENIDLKNMPPLLQSFVVQSIINPHGQGNVTDMELQGELKQYIKQEKQAAAEKQTQEVRLIKSEAEMKEMDAERNRQAMDEERKKRMEKIK
jgi:hypothetical protein